MYSAGIFILFLIMLKDEFNSGMFIHMYFITEDK